MRVSGVVVRVRVRACGWVRMSRPVRLREKVRVKARVKARRGRGGGRESGEGEGGD